MACVLALFHHALWRPARVGQHRAACTSYMGGILNGTGSPRTPPPTANRSGPTSALAPAHRWLGARRRDIGHRQSPHGTPPNHMGCIWRGKTGRNRQVGGFSGSMGSFVGGVKRFQLMPAQRGGTLFRPCLLARSRKSTVRRFRRAGVRIRGEHSEVGAFGSPAALCLDPLNAFHAREKSLTGW